MSAFRERAGKFLCRVGLHKLKTKDHACGDGQVVTKCVRPGCQFVLSDFVFR